jgi:hypothetical protein
VPNHPVGVQPQPPPILLGVDRPPRSGRSPGDRCWPWSRDGQVVQDCPTVPLQGSAVGRCAAPPAAPRRQVTVSGATRNRSSQPSPAATVTPANAAKWGAIWVASSQAARPTAKTAAIRQGTVTLQAVHSAGRRRWVSAWAEAPGRPTLARTRTASTGAGAPHRTASPGSWSSLRWARSAARSAWLSGRTDTPGGWSSQVGQTRSGSESGWGRGMLASL